MFNTKLVVLAMMCIVAVRGAAFFQQGPCPDGRSEGSIWYEGRSRCDCHQTGWGCAGCGVIGAGPTCHVVENSTAPYPDCCPKMVC